MDALNREVRAVCPDQPDIADIIAAHLKVMRASSPACSVHALDADRYEATGTTLFALYEDDTAVAIGALRAYAPASFEIKSMHVRAAHRGRGLAREILHHLLTRARANGGSTVSLETGSQEVFEPARRLYRNSGFAECPPFGDYKPDSNSTFMTREL